MKNGVRKNRKVLCKRNHEGSVAPLGSLVGLVSSWCVVLGTSKFSQTTCKFVMYEHQNRDVNSKPLQSYQLVC